MTGLWAALQPKREEDPLSWPMDEDRVTRLLKNYPPPAHLDYRVPAGET